MQSAHRRLARELSMLRADAARDNSIARHRQRGKPETSVALVQRQIASISGGMSWRGSQPGGGAQLFFEIAVAHRIASLPRAAAAIVVTRRRRRS